MNQLWQARTPDAEAVTVAINGSTNCKSCGETLGDLCRCIRCIVCQEVIGNWSESTVWNFQQYVKHSETHKAQED